MFSVKPTELYVGMEILDISLSHMIVWCPCRYRALEVDVARDTEELSVHLMMFMYHRYNSKTHILLMATE